MRNKVHDILKVVGRKVPDAGGAMYHAADGVSGGGFFDKNKRHRMRLALRNMRLRASGMTDDLLGSKEGGGSMDNKHEQEP
jgi:hypothetical protein